MGHPDQATAVLRSIARVVLRDGGFSEYYEAGAEAQKLGAFRYGFSAAPYLRAVIEGLFGLKPDYYTGTLDVCPSLRQSGHVACRLGRHTAELRVMMGSPTQSITLSLTTDYRGPARFRVLLPDGVRTWSLRRGREVLSVSRSREGSAEYARFHDVISGGETQYVLAGTT